MGTRGDGGGDGTGNGAKPAAGETEGAGAALLVSPPWPGGLTPGFGRRWVRADRAVIRLMATE